MVRACDAGSLRSGPKERKFLIISRISWEPAIDKHSIQIASMPSIFTIVSSHKLNISSVFAARRSECEAVAMPSDS